MSKVLWKSWELLKEEEQKVYLENSDMLDCYLDNTNEDIEDFDKEAFEEYVRDCYDDYFDADFGENGNWSCSPLKNQKVVVVGELGLWDGKHTIVPTEFDNLYDAIQQCLEDYSELIEEENGDLIVKAHHHDGINNFIIKKLFNGNAIPLEFSKTVFGA